MNGLEWNERSAVYIRGVPDVTVELDATGHLVSMTVEHARQQMDVNEFSYQLATA